MIACLARLIALALGLSTLAAHARSPQIGEPLVATDAGFVLFGHDGVFHSADGRSFNRTDSFFPANDFKAVPVRDGIVAIDRAGLRRLDQSGRLIADVDVREPLVDIASHGAFAVAISHGGLVLSWDGQNWMRTHVAEGSGATANLVTYAFQRWWVCGSLPEGEEETSAALWTSTDGRHWTAVALPTFPANLGGQSWPPAEFHQMVAVPGCLLAVSPYGLGASSRDGRTWKWIYAGSDDPAVATRLSVSLSRILRRSFRGETLVAQAISLDGEKWLPAPAQTGWSEWTEIPSHSSAKLLARPQAGGEAVIVDVATFRDPTAFLAQLATDRAAAELAARQRATAEAEARALADQRAREQQAARAQAEAEAQRQAQQAELARRLAPALAAIAKFEQAALAATSPEQLGQPAGEFIAALTKHGDAPLAEAAYQSLRNLLFDAGGARGYHAFLMALPDARLSDAMSHLLRRGTAAQKDLVRALAAYQQNVQFNRPATPVDTRGWPPAKRAKGNPQRNDQLDLAVVHRQILTGARGALLDALVARSEGYGAAIEPVLSVMWGDMLFHLVPDLERLKPEETKFLEVAAAQGSGMAEFELARAALLRTPRPDGAVPRERLARAAERGVIAATRLLASLSSPAPAANSTATDWFSAATVVNGMRAQTEAERLRSAAPAAPAGDDSLVSDEEMGLGADALASSRAQLKAMGLSDADIAAFDRQSSQRMSDLMTDLRARGLTDEQIAANLRTASTALLTPDLPTFATQPRLNSHDPGVELRQLVNFPHEIRAVRYFSGAYHAVTAQGIVLRSTDGRTWAQLFAPAAGGSFEDICGGDGRILLIPPATVRLTASGKPNAWISVDHGRNWQAIALGFDDDIAYVAGQFWRFRVGDRSAFESSSDLKSWQRHVGLPADLIAQAPTLRLGHVQLFAGRVYRFPRFSSDRSEGDKIESSADLQNWRLEFQLPTNAADRVLPIQFEVCGDTLVLGTMVALGKGKVQYHLLAPGQPWRVVPSQRTALGSIRHAGGWTLLHDNALFGGLVEVTRGFQRTRSLGDLSGHASRFAFGPAGFVLGGDQGRIAILRPDRRWDLRPAHEPLAEARTAHLKGQYDQMQRLIAEARLDDPHDAAAYALEARASFERNQSDAVRTILAAGLQHHPKDPTLLGLRAHYRVSTQDTAGAKQDADAALAVSATQPDAALARFILTQGVSHEALDVALALNKTFVTGFVTRAALRNAKGDRAGMLADLQAAEASRPEHADFQLTMAGMYLQLGLNADARRCALKARDLGHPRAAEALKLIPAS